MTRRPVTLAVLAAALVLVLVPTATAAGPPIDIEPPGSVPSLLAHARHGRIARRHRHRRAQEGRRRRRHPDGRHQAAAPRPEPLPPVKGAAGRELAAVAASAVRIARTSGFTPQRAREVFLELSVNVTGAAEGPAGRPRPQAHRLADVRALPRPGPPHPAAGIVVVRPRHGAPRRRRVTKRLLDKALELSVASSAARCRRSTCSRSAPARRRWSSPMAHSLAMDALARGFALTGDERYRTAALQFAKGVAVDPTSRPAARCGSRSTRSTRACAC